MTSPSHPSRQSRHLRAAERSAAVERLRSDVADQLAGYRADAVRRAADAAARCAADAAARRYVGASLRADLGRARAEARAEQQRRLAAARLALRHDTNELLTDLVHAREAMGAAQRQALVESATALRHNTTELLIELVHAREAMGAAQRQRLDAALAALRSDTAALLGGLAAAREAMGAAQRAGLDAFSANLRSDTAALLSALAQERQSSGLAQRERLAGAIAALRDSTAAFLSGLAHSRGRAARPALAAPPRHAPAPAALSSIPPARPPLAAPPAPPASAQRVNHAGLTAYAQLVRVTISKELEASHGAPNSAQRQTISACVDGLASSVAGLLRDLESGGAEQRALAVEHLDGLRRNSMALLSEVDGFVQIAADSYVIELRQMVARIAEDVAFACESVGQASGDGPRPHPSPSHDIRDDLTVIRGIGPGTQQKLAQAGIVTYIQIALSTPDELRRALGASASRLAAVEEWIARARELAGLG